MEDIEYCFYDPGFKNLGIVFLKFEMNPKTKEKEIKLQKYTLDVTKNDKMVDFQTFSQYMDNIVKSISDDFVLCSESNLFVRNSQQSKDIGYLQGMFEGFFTFKFSLNLKVFSVNALNVGPILNICKEQRREKKEIVKNAFCNVFNLDQATFHEADAFAAGVCCIIQNSNEFNEEIKSLANFFCTYVQTPFANNTKNKSRKSKF